MKFTSIIKKLRGMKPATPREMCQLAMNDPEVREILTKQKNSVQTFATILHKADIKRNPRGWCTSEAGKPLRYTIPEQTVKKPAADFSRSNFNQQLVMFFGTLNIFAQVITRSTTSETGARFLPDIVGAALPEDLMLWAKDAMGHSHGAVPARIIACVIAKEITQENLNAVMMDAAIRTRCANDGYIVTAYISDDPVVTNELKLISEALRVGVILLDGNTRVNKAHIFHPVQPKLAPDLKSLCISGSQVPELHSAALTSKIGAYLDHCTYAPANFSTELAGQVFNRLSAA